MLLHCIDSSIAELVLDAAGQRYPGTFTLVRHHACWSNHESIWHRHGLHRQHLPQSIMNLGNNAFSIAAYFLICVVIVPWFILPAALLVLFGPWLVKGFLACTRDMQRIEATSTSPIYGHFQQALSGIVTIRAYGAEPRLLESMLDAVDLYQSLWWAVCTMDVWLSFRSQILGGVSVFLVTLLALSGAVSPGSAGLALSSAQSLCQLAFYLVNDFKNLANSFNSLERVAEYQQMPREESDAIVARYSSSSSSSTASGVRQAGRPQRVESYSTR